MKQNRTEGSLSFREMVPEDASDVALVEEACFSMPWSRESFWQEASNENTYYLLALWDDKIVGYAGAWIVAGEAQITNVAVHPDYRKRGIATEMMSRMIQHVKSIGVTAMTLEVRPSNTAALTLYEKFGLKSVGRRKGYYQDNGEDAIIMWNTNL
ncbi:MAG: ribosomal protein S18-alanine N-acetyltransferase [Selenomonadaceae bacterium]|nr:ribosomal protein S18-alanine N-acetyltransferase [Selenomonadaceae bacterium]